MTVRILRFIIAGIASVLLASCIHNDIPYARIQAGFTAFAVEGQDAGTAIDSASRTVTVTLPEEIDITNVKVASYALTPDANIVGGDPFTSPIDLSQPMAVTLRLYQDWQWTITARQTIERYFEVAGQMGSTTIDVAARTVTVYVRETADLSAIRIVRAKLGPAGSSYSPSIAEGSTFDGRSPFEITVEEYGRPVVWTVTVETVEVSVITTGVDAWTCVAWVHGQAEAGRDNGVEYRLVSDTGWTRIPASAVSQNGGSFTGRIDHLQPQTQYVARTYSDTDTGEEVTFTTGLIVQPPNADFDQWWLDGKVWCPWPEGGEQYWDTGNKGATTLGNSNSVPTTDTPSGTGWAAMLETRFVGISFLGKLAAGNLFAGRYVRTDGTNGILSFGQPFTERPTRLKGMYKYTCTEISKSNNEMKDLIGRPDTCIVWVALIDSDEPFEIRTNPSNRKLFDPEGPEVIAYGAMQQGQTVAEWTPFQVDLKYCSTSRVPKYILITNSASKYGDYFTGGEGSVLYLDDFVLEYDY